MSVLVSGWINARSLIRSSSIAQLQNTTVEAFFHSIMESQQYSHLNFIAFAQKCACFLNKCILNCVLTVIYFCLSVSFDCPISG